MSDRLILLPYSGRLTIAQADLWVSENSEDAELHSVGRKFAMMPGPHRVYTDNRSDPRLRIISLAAEEAGGYCEASDDDGLAFSVWTPEDFLHNIVL